MTDTTIPTPNLSGLGYEDMLLSLKRVSQGREDYVYKAPSGVCQYFHDGQPSCLVGHVLVDLGITSDMFSHSRWEGVRAAVVLAEMGVRDPAVVTLANATQRAQDEGMPWGQAIDEGVAYVGRVPVGGDRDE